MIHSYSAVILTLYLLLHKRNQTYTFDPMPEHNMTQSEASATDREALKSRILPQMAFNKVKAAPTKGVPNSQTGDMAKLRFKVVGSAMYMNSLLSYTSCEANISAESQAEQVHLG